MTLGININGNQQGASNLLSQGISEHRKVQTVIRSGLVVILFGILRVVN